MPPANAASRSSRRVTSPLMKRAVSGTFSRNPVARLSITVTSCPSATKRSAMCEPMKPAPPVTRIRMRWFPSAIGGDRCFFWRKAARLGDGGAENLRIRSHPVREPLDPRFPVDQRLPAHDGAGLADVTDIARLIPGTPVTAAYLHLLALQLRQHLTELVPHRESVAGAATDVEDIAGGDVDLLRCQPKRPHEVIDEKHVPDLLAVTVDRNGLAGHRGDDEVGNPSLVLVAELSWTVYAAHPEDDRRQVVDPRVIAHILVRGALRATVGRVEVEWL